MNALQKETMRMYADCVACRISNLRALATARRVYAMCLERGDAHRDAHALVERLLAKDAEYAAGSLQHRAEMSVVSVGDSVMVAEMLDWADGYIVADADGRKAMMEAAQ